ncbi:MAG: fibronectin type III domain-containing protein [Thermoguttaceae bacterium]|nr:fibronectin type III domain-containing protein [Thermoguttaceae bacterium]
MKNKSQDSSSHRLCFEYLENRELLSATPLDATVNDPVVLSASVGAPICLNGSGPEVAADVTNAVSGPVALSNQNMLEYACSETSPDESELFSPAVEELLASVSATGWNPVKRWVYYDDGMYDQASNQAPLNYYYGTDGAIKLKEDGPLCQFIDRAKELELNGIVWKCEIDNCFNRAYLEWDPIAGAQSYRVFQSTDNGQTYVNVMSGISDCCYNVPLLKSDAVYTFKVDALGNNGKPLATMYVGTLNASTRAATSSNPNAFRLYHIVDERVSFLEQVKAYADKKEIEIIPTFWAVGCNAFLSQDASLVEGRLVEYAPFNINEDPNFQDHEVAGDGFEGKWSNVPTNWEKTDTSLNFVEKSDGASEGSSSVLVKIPKLKASDGIKRVFTGLEDGYYYVTCKVRIDGANYAEMKVQNPDNPNSNAYVDYKPGNENFEPNQWGTMTSGVVMVTQGRLEIQLSGAGQNGRLWFDDVDIIRTTSPGFLPIPREGTPIHVYIKTENGEFEEVPQKNSDGTTNWKLPAEYKEHYKFDYGKGFYAEFEEGIELKSIDIIPQDSPLRSTPRLDKIYIDYYEPTPNQYNPQRYSVCLSEEGLYDLMEESVSVIQEVFSPKTWFIGFDEVTIGGTCQTCLSTELTTAQIFGRSVTEQCNIIRNVKNFDPESNIVVWSDMFDPNHNAKGADEPYQYVSGSLENVVDYIPNDLIIACWYDGSNRDELALSAVQDRAEKTLRFFSEKGFRTISSCYYDWSSQSKGGFDNTEMPTNNLDINTQGWLNATVNSGEALRGNLGMFYVTWPESGKRDYAYLAPFGVALNQIKQSNDSIRFSDYDAVSRTGTLEWNAVDGASSYVVKLSKDGGATWATYKRGLTGTSTTINGLYVGKSYVFRVHSVSGGVESADCQATVFVPTKLTASTDVWSPDEPISLSLSGAKYASADIRWYQIVNGVQVEIESARNSFRYTPTSGAFYIQVVATGTGYSSGSSSSLTFAPASLGNVSVTRYTYTSDVHQALVKWPTVPDAAFYNLEYSEDGGATWKLYAKNFKNHYKGVNGVYPGKTYHFRVTPLDANKQPMSSTYVKGTFAPVVLTHPASNYTAGTKIELTRLASKDGTSTIRWYYVKNGSDVEIKSARNQLTFTPDAADYDVKVVSTGTGLSLKSNYELTLSAHSAINVRFNYNAATRKAVMTWPRFADATTYTVKLSKDGGETWTTYKSGLTTPQTTVNGLYAGRTYAFRVMAISSSKSTLATYQTTFSPSGSSSAALDEAFAEFFEEALFEEF